MSVLTRRFALTLAVLLISPLAFAQSDLTPLAHFIVALAVIAPLAISPLFALAMLGLAINLGFLPELTGLAWTNSPLVYAPLMAVSLMLALGRSNGITKPLAEISGLFEHVLGGGVLGYLLFSLFSQTPLGVFGGLLAGGLGLGAWLLILSMRGALDLLTWLSPFPFLDFFFQGGKLALVACLVGASVLSPWLGLALGVVLLLAGMRGYAWAYRAASLGWTVALDLVKGDQSHKHSLPVDAINPEDIGPISAYVLRHEELPERVSGAIQLEAGRWFFVTGRQSQDRYPLGDQAETELSLEVYGVRLETPKGAVLLPPRYKHLALQIIAMNAAQPKTEEERSKFQSKARVRPKMQSLGH